MISGSPRAYRHLADSIEAFMEREVLIERIQKSGFGEVRIEVLTFGIASLFSGKKP
jgi:ubiquinone/menaquinone biosynthesis C-methylase UbiE